MGGGGVGVVWSVFRWFLEGDIGEWGTVEFGG